MHASIRQTVEQAIATLSQRNAFKIGDDEFRVRSLFPVHSWKPHTSSCRQAGSLIVGEDDCGNLFLCAPDGSVSFWDHEANEETALAASVGTFCDCLVEPTPVVLQPEQIKRAWIDPDFLASQRKKGNANGQ